MSSHNGTTTLACLGFVKCPGACSGDLYYSQAQDWHEPGGAGNTWDFGPDPQRDRSGAYDRYLREKAEPQGRKLLTRYGPVSCIWFDTPQMMTFERGQRFVDLVHGHHDRDWKLPTEILFKLVDTW